jgi:hypothetical protein
MGEVMLLIFFKDYVNSFYDECSESYGMSHGFSLTGRCILGASKFTQKCINEIKMRALR